METGVKTSIKVENLVFDPKNPRVPQSLQGIKDEAKIIEYMVLYGNVTDLMLSIAETGYSDAEPLLVVRDDKGKYVVVEGNRRLAALKLLNNPNLTDIRVKLINEIIENAQTDIPQEVPCVVYQNRNSILDYLGYRHITGVKDWGPLEKARYLEQLYELHIEDAGIDNIYKKLAKMIGSKASYVKNLHMALKLYDLANDEAYYGAEIKDKDINFSWITTVLGYTGISEYIGFDANDISTDKIDKERFKNVFLWMFDPEKAVVGESRQLSKLSTVLSSKEATEKLEKGASLSEAILYTSEPEEVFKKMLERAKAELEHAKSAIEQLNRKPEETDDLLRDIDKLRKTIVGALAANFDDELQEFMKQPLSSLKGVTPEQMKQIMELIGKSSE